LVGCFKNNSQNAVSTNTMSTHVSSYCLFPFDGLYFRWRFFGQVTQLPLYYRGHEITS
jgi:hypothetical protein